MEMSMMDRWLGSRVSFEKAAELNMKLMYPSEGKLKENVAEALAFWNFIFYNAPWNKNNLVWVEWMRRSKLLFPFMLMKSDNVFISVVAAIESLPDSVLRKIMVKYNDHFLSHESFLRKMTGDQVIAIWNSHDCLYQDQKIPPVFGAWERFRGKVSLEKIFAEKWDYNERYRVFDKLK